MLFPRLVPILLIENRRLVKTGNFNDASYVGDVMNSVRIFNEKEVDEIVILDISTSKLMREPDYTYIEMLAGECFMPLTYGGGISSVEHARRVMECGVEKVSMNRAVSLLPELSNEVSNVLGRSSTVLSIDVEKSGSGYIPRGSNETLQAMLSLAKERGFGEILIQAVEKDGLQNGPDIDLLNLVMQYTDVPVVYAGGVSSLDQCSEIWSMGISAVGAGAWFVYRGPHKAVMITYPKYDKVKLAYEKVKSK